MYSLLLRWQTKATLYLAVPEGKKAKREIDC